MRKTLESFNSSPFEDSLPIQADELGYSKAIFSLSSVVQQVQYPDMVIGVVTGVSNLGEDQNTRIKFKMFDITGE